MIDNRKTDTKERTINFVIDEISEKGYANISLREIAKKQSISAAALYKHFQGKDDLFNTVLIRVSHIVYEFYQTEKDKMGNCINSKHNLFLFGKTILQMFESKPLLMDFLFFSPYGIKAYQDLTDVDTPYSFLKEYKELISRFVHENRVKVDTETLSIKLWAFIQGYSMLVTNKIVVYDDSLLESTLDDITYSLLKGGRGL